MRRRRPGRAHLHLLERRVRPARVVVLGALLGALFAAVPAAAAPVPAGPTAGVAAAPGPKKPRCDGAVGWAAYSGRPASLTPLGSAGLYVWNERGVWRIAVTHGDKRPQLFQGTVTFDAPVTRANGVEGKSTIGPAGPSAVAFTFKNYGQVDGIAVTASCATSVTVTGQVDGQPLASTALFLGPTAVNPASVPTVLVRGGTDAAATATTLPATTAPTTTAACAAAAAWPASTAGRPPVNRLRGAGSPAVVFVWSDRNTWRLLVSTDLGRAPVVEGRISASAPLTARILDGGRDGGREGGGRDRVQVDGNAVTFRARGTAQGTLLEIGTGCSASLVIESLSIDGEPLASGELVVGAGAAAPAVLPYAVAR